MFQTKAKKFDMQKQRIIDSDHKQLLNEQKKEERKFGGLKSKSKRPTATSGGKGKWLKQSEQFRNAMRAARGAKPLEPSGGGFGGGDSYEPDNGLVPCPTWGRSFNEKAAERHIPSCANRAKEAAMKKGPPRKNPIGKYR